MRVLGFTGTRNGMTDWQRRRLRAFLKHHRPARFHHGDCIGSDAQAHAMVRQILPTCHIISHPSTIRRLRAFCNADEVYDALEPLDRNRRIVAETEELVATPEQNEEELRSGTWATIRAAVRCGKEVEVIETAEGLTIKWWIKL